MLWRMVLEVNAGGQSGHPTAPPAIQNLEPSAALTIRDVRTGFVLGNNAAYRKGGLSFRGGIRTALARVPDSETNYGHGRVLREMGLEPRE